jgi:tRNA-specific 2-thiouridylase
MNKKCIVLFSGGLDSRLAVKIMQEKGFIVEAVNFILPFSCTCSFDSFGMPGVKFRFFDCTKGKLLKEYLEIIKKAKHGRGASFNPCKDCKIWMFKKVKKYADKKNIGMIATGEVLGQRPMSQTAGAMKKIDESLGFKLERPLIDLGVSGRSRKKQIALAKKYKISSFPQPAGGCLLCEKKFKKRFEFLINRGLIDKETLCLVRLGRHFVIDNRWVVTGRNKEENKIILRLKKGKKITPDFRGPVAVILGKANREIISRVKELLKAYSKDYPLVKRKNFEKFKI